MCIEQCRRIIKGTLLDIYRVGFSTKGKKRVLSLLKKDEKRFSSENLGRSGNYPCSVDVTKIPLVEEG